MGLHHEVSVCSCVHQVLLPSEVVSGVILAKHFVAVERVIDDYNLAKLLLGNLNLISIKGDTLDAQIYVCFEVPRPVLVELLERKRDCMEMCCSL